MAIVLQIEYLPSMDLVAPIATAAKAVNLALSLEGILRPPVTTEQLLELHRIHGSRFSVVDYSDPFLPSSMKALKSAPRRTSYSDVSQECEAHLSVVERPLDDIFEFSPNKLPTLDSHRQTIQNSIHGSRPIIYGPFQQQFPAIAAAGNRNGISDRICPTQETPHPTHVDELATFSKLQHNPNIPLPHLTTEDLATQHK